MAISGGDPFYLKLFVNRPQLERNHYFQPIFASSASAVASSKKVLLTLIDNALSNEPKMNIVRCP